MRSTHTHTSQQQRRRSVRIAEAATVCPTETETVDGQTADDRSAESQPLTGSPFDDDDDGDDGCDDDGGCATCITAKTVSDCSWQTDNSSSRQTLETVPK